MFLVNDVQQAYGFLESGPLSHVVTKDQWSESLLWKSFVQYTELWGKGTAGWCSQIVQ